MLSDADSLNCRFMGRALLNSFVPGDKPRHVMRFYLLSPWMKYLRVTRFKQTLFTVMMFVSQHLAFKTKCRIYKKIPSVEKPLKLHSLFRPVF